jgi:predicted RNase H-like HicB family nuclease
MKSYLALVEAGDGRHAYGIRFPDLPNVFSAADTEDDIVANAVEALRLWAEDQALPEPSGHAAIVAREDVKKDLRKGWYLIDVPLIEDDPKVVRVNITLERGVLDAIDSKAKSWGTTRSGFISLAAQSKIERSDRAWMRARAAKMAAAAAKKPIAVMKAAPAKNAVDVAKGAAPAKAKKAAPSKMAHRQTSSASRKRKG